MPKVYRVSLAAIAVVMSAFQQTPTPPASHLADPFATGWMLVDTNGDGIADFIEGKVVVPTRSSEAENAAAANLAARLGYGSTGITLPLVVNSSDGTGPRIWVGKDALPPALSAEAAAWIAKLQKEEGGIFALGTGLAVLGADDEGLLAAAEAYSARAPYQWKLAGDRLAQLGDIAGVTYARGKAGVNRAFPRTGDPVVFAPPGAPAAAPPAAPAADATGNPPPKLDLASLYTSRGLFTGTPRMPVPSTLDAHLYVPAGAAGVAMANLAARMGMETTGISLPLASPASKAAVRDVRLKAVIAGNSPVAQEAERKLHAPSESALGPGEGELNIVDDAFTRRPAVLVRGDETGSAAALQLLSGHLPNLWETGKQHASLEELRYDLHRFFSTRSSAGQVSAAMYHLERWSKEIGAGATDVSAE
ncbi:MAG TPA: hypothetical protein VGF49_13370, partial [Candidatus Solibacter sp.]